MAPHLDPGNGCGTNVGRVLAVAVALHLLVPAVIHGAAGAGEVVVDAHGLHRILGLEFPTQLFTRHKLTQARVERADMVILQINLNKGLPVVGALVNLDVVKAIIFKVEVLASFHAG